MQNQLTVNGEKEERIVQYQVNNETVKLSRSVVRNSFTTNPKVTNAEINQFISLCKYQHLNPFLKEAYIVKYGDKPAQLITSKEAFMKRAENNPNYDGFKAGVVVLRNNEIKYLNGALILNSDQLIGGWCDVFRKDRKVPQHVEISISEFSKGQSTWNTMPATMIRKTAIVNALREAFPNALGALYTEDDKVEDADAPTVKSIDATEKDSNSVDALLNDADSKTKAETVKEVSENDGQTTIFDEIDGR